MFPIFSNVRREDQHSQIKFTEISQRFFQNCWIFQNMVWTISGTYSKTLNRKQIRSNLEIRSYNKDTSSYFFNIPITPNPPRLRSTAPGTGRRRSAPRAGPSPGPRGGRLTLGSSGFSRLEGGRSLQVKIHFAGVFEICNIIKPDCQNSADFHRIWQNDLNFVKYRWNFAD